MKLTERIKSEAMGNMTVIQSTLEREIEQRFNQLFFLEKNIEEETAFVKQVMTRGLESQKRIGLHASAMLKGKADFCLRAQVLSLIYEQAQGENVPTSLKRIFEEGNAIHEKWQRLFLRGNLGHAVDMDYTNYHEQYMLSFTPDGIITLDGINNNEPIIVEIKSVNTFQFQKMLKENKKHPSAWKQAQWYMHLKGYKMGIVLNEDKNTQEFKVEVHEYDPEKVQPYIDRCEEIVSRYHKVFNQHRMVNRPPECTSSECKKCSKCFMRDACWNIGMGRIRLENTSD